MAMASTTSADAAPAASSVNVEQEPSSTLTTLVPHFQMAQRSLYSMEHVSQAQNVIKLSREMIESQSAMDAHTQFIGMQTQELFSTVGKVIQIMEAVKSETGREANHLMDRVELARSRLEQSVEALKGTAYDAKLRGRLHAEVQPVVEDPTQNLMDFLDDSGPEELLRKLNTSYQILSAEDSRFEMSIEKLWAGRDKLEAMLKYLGSGAPRKRSSMLPVLEEMHIFHSEMTANMEGLIEHYDRCRTAIHHTDGEGVAALNMAKDIPDGIDLDLARDQPLQEVSEEEMQELRVVIEKDAAEVEDVVADIRTSMEQVQTAAERIARSNQRSRNELEHARTAFSALEALGKSLPSNITQSELYAVKCEEERGKILEYVEELEALRHFYIDFHRAYDHLLIEIGRRKDFERRLDSMRNTAMEKLNEVIGEESEIRQAFIRDYEDILPLDVWPGLPLPPTRYEFIKVQNSGDSLPDISASVINKAIKRVSQDNR